MVEADAISAAVKARSYFLLVHLRRDSAAQHGHVGGRGPRDAGKEHAEQCHHLRQPAAQVSDEGLGEADHALGHVGRGHQLADQQEEGNRE